MPPSNTLEEVKAAIVSRVLDNEYIAQECEFFETSFLDGEHSYIQGVASITPDPDLKIYFSIPEYTANIFITVSDGLEEFVRKIIGNIDQIDVNDPSYFTTRKVVRFENEELNKLGIFGVVLLPLSVSGILDDMEEVFEFSDKEYSFQLVSMLSKAEIELWEKDGFENLMEYFDTTDKDLLSFEQRLA